MVLPSMVRSTAARREAGEVACEGWCSDDRGRSDHNPLGMAVNSREDSVRRPMIDQLVSSVLS